MQSLPDKIQMELEKLPELKWIDSHDRIFSNEQLCDPLKLENQRTFWKVNCAIRIALKEIEADIKRSTTNLSARLVGWSEIARRAKCDRNTLKRPERINWINERREILLKLIADKKLSTTKPLLTILKSDVDQLVGTQKEVELAKTEAAKWFVKYEEAQREMKLLKLALQRQIKTNNNLTEQLQIMIKEKNTSS